MYIDSLPGRIAEHAMKAPEKIALEYGERKISYRELEQSTNRIAHFLSKKMQNTRNILVMLERGPELVASALGIFKAGGLFVPLDGKYPEKRIRLMITEVQADWIIVNNSELPRLNRILIEMDQTINALVLNEEIELVKDTQHYSQIRLYHLTQEDSTDFSYNPETMHKHCYIYFTSGSTGTPKGIVGRHKSLLHFIDWEIKEFDVTANFRHSQFVSPAFDPFLRDMLVPLCAGATLCIPETDEIILDSQKMAHWLDTKDIHCVHMTPLLFKSLSTQLEQANFSNLKYIFLAGEMLRGNDLKNWIAKFKERIQLVNLYGPTETTLAKFFHRIQMDDINNVNIPVGKPITMTELLLLDKDLKKCRDGWIGEVYIRTPYISSGYYNRPELSREVFLRNPFTNNPQDIIYKTGDLGRIKSDGNLELVGRVDFQIKIRGVRIEPGEIENQLLKYPGIKEAVVMGREDKLGEMYLTAYYLAEEEIPVIELRKYLKESLTDAMIPAYFVQMVSMPLTPNGKIDRKALPEPDETDETGMEYQAPVTDTEEKLAFIWAEVLGRKRVGTLDNFFALGGHSLKAAAVVARIAKELKTELSLRALFQFPTIQELAKYIDQAQVSQYASIARVEECAYYPVSAAQKRLFVLYQMDDHSTSYNMPRVLLVEGSFERERFAEAMRKLIMRHESLRTSFELMEGEIIQRIHPNVDFVPMYREAQEAELQHIVNEFIQPFDLSMAPLFRAGLVKFGDKHLLLFDIHHIIADGISMGIITRDFIKLYFEVDLPEMRIQYRDFAIWQNRLLQSEIYQKQEDYWLNIFSDEIPVLHLPYDFSRPALNTYAGDHYEIELGQELTAQLQTLAMKHGATLFMVLLTAYFTLLHKETGQEDIVVGTPIAGRPHADLENMIGMFVNTLALRNTPQREKTFNQFIEEVKENTLEAFEHQGYQFDMLVDKLSLERDLSRNPLFDVMFSLHNAGEMIDIATEGLHFQPFNFANPTSKFDLEMKMIEIDQGKNYLMNLEYSTQLFRMESIERLAGHFMNLLHSIIANPDAPLGEIEILSPEEKALLIDGFNANQVKLDTQHMIHQLIELNAEKYPERIAISCIDESLTYRELNERANQLAQVLRKNGIGRDQLVGVLMQRSLTMAESIFAVWKAGGAYIPIDPAYPVQRIGGILEDAGAQVLLTQTEHIDDELPTLFTGTIIDLMTLDNEIRSESKNNLIIERDINDLAYVIYTSGSTGKPKGAMVEQIGMLNHMYAKINDLHLTENCIVAQNASHCFDISVWQFFVALVLGGKTVVYPNELTLNPSAFINQVIADELTILEVVPSYLATMLDFLEHDFKEFKRLDYLLVTGEAVKPVLIKRWFRLYPDIKMVNAYGPTEASDDITHFIIDHALECEQVPIGRPVQNFHIYIVDQNMHLCPLGVKGEICVSGIGVGRGYLNDLEKTRAAFMEDPFSPISNVRLYKTGDLGRWLPDGTIEFFGRKDYQVKIRGFRIELGEIENKLVKHPSIKESVVIDRQDANGNKYLCAYIVTETSVAISEVRAFLANELPEYMIPSFIITLPSLPLNPNGKIDRKALPEPEGNIERDVVYIAPETKVEKIMVQIWSEVLNVSEVGLNDNFFDLGGDSIKAIQLIAKANLEGLHLSVRDIFKYKTIAEILKNVNYQEGALKISQEEVEGEVLLTPIQRWFFECNLKYPHYWYQANMFRLKEDTDLVLLEKVFQKIIEHHDSFRMTFKFTDNGVIQYNQKVADVNFRLRIFDLSAEPYELQLAHLQEKCETVLDELDLSKGLPIHGIVFDLGPNGKRLVIAIHHLVMDGFSWRILLEDISTLYESKLEKSLPLKTTSYKEWSSRLHEYAQTAELDLSYWEKINRSKIKVLASDSSGNLFSQVSRGVIRLDADITEKLLTQVNRTYQTQIDDILLSALTLAYTEALETDNILLILESHGREELIEGVDLTRTIGWFTCEYPVYLEKQSTIPETIRYVHNNLQSIPHKGLDYCIGRYLKQDKKLDGLKPEIAFNYLGQFGFQDANSILTGSPEAKGANIHGDNQRQTVINVNAIVLGKEMAITIGYHHAYVSHEIMERFRLCYENRLHEIIEHCLLCAEGGAKAFTVNHQYPDYYDCLMGTTLEKVRYDANYQITHGFLPAGEGRGLVGYIDVIKQEDAFYHVSERNYGLQVGFLPNQQRYRLSAELKTFTSFEEFEEYLRDAFLHNRVVIMRGVTYHLNYTPEYHDDEFWRKKVENSPNADHSHTFLVIGATARGYLVYDTAYNYHGEIMKEDLQKAFAGLDDIDFLRNHPAKSNTSRKCVIEINTTNLQKLAMEELAQSLLHQYIDTYLTSKQITVEKNGIIANVYTGLDAFKAMATDIGKYCTIFAESKDLQQALLDNLLSFKDKLTILRDFFKDYQKYYTLPNGTTTDIEEAINLFAQMLEVNKALNAASSDSFLENVIMSLHEIYTSLSRLFYMLEKSLA